ncbi:hypothetical protein DFP72DRAFT_881139 [Ephemerocybe angulata]|uniref:Uncharacterized protein n=1 Tax=Ephemerocybe angulata TaxID=980116 RepID=A0A8H6IBT9_9AGAR|nr:hypothetical protein DFP72DRAFT_881139 [Tulosesus angulatus]
MVDSINYLVDFHHKKSYKASVEPGAGRFDMAHFEVIQDSSSDSSRSVKEKEGLLGRRMRWCRRLCLWMWRVG